MTKITPGFKINDAGGFQIVFENGWCVSVAFGPYHYCSNRDFDSVAPKTLRGEETLNLLTTKFTPEAEMAVISPADQLIPLKGDTVAGWQSPETIAKVIYTTSMLKADTPEKVASKRVRRHLT